MKLLFPSLILVIVVILTFCSSCTATTQLDVDFVVGEKYIFDVDSRVEDTIKYFGEKTKTDIDEISYRLSFEIISFSSSYDSIRVKTAPTYPYGNQHYGESSYLDLSTTENIFGHMYNDYSPFSFGYTVNQSTNEVTITSIGCSFNSNYFIKPEWDEINTQAKKTSFNSTNERLSNILGNCSSTRLNGNSNWNDGVDSLNSDTHQWSIELISENVHKRVYMDEQTESIQYSHYRAFCEVEYSVGGVLNRYKLVHEYRINGDYSHRNLLEITREGIELVDNIGVSVPGFEWMIFPIFVGIISTRRKRRV